MNSTAEVAISPAHNYCTQQTANHFIPARALFFILGLKFSHQLCEPNAYEKRFWTWSNTSRSVYILYLNSLLQIAIALVKKYILSKYFVSVFRYVSQCTLTIPGVGKGGEISRGPCKESPATLQLNTFELPDTDGRRYWGDHKTTELYRKLNPSIFSTGALDVGKNEPGFVQKPQWFKLIAQLNVLNVLPETWQAQRRDQICRNWEKPRKKRSDELKSNRLLSVCQRQKFS